MVFKSTLSSIKKWLPWDEYFAYKEPPTTHPSESSLVGPDKIINLQKQLGSQTEQKKFE